MNKRFHILIAIGGLLVGLAACMEIHPLVSPHDPVSSPGSTTVVTCKAPPVEKNIVGTWYFESTNNFQNAVMTGTVTFSSQREMVDPDSLFENHLDVGGIVIVTAKTYNPSVISTFPFYSGMLFEVYQDTKKGRQTTYFVPVVNECNKVILWLIGSENYVSRITLTR